jgi:hypothetical protein
LNSEGFYAVDLAEGAIDHWYGIRDYELGRHEGYNSDTIRTQIDKLEEIVGWIEEARKHLRALDGRSRVDRGAQCGRRPEGSDRAATLDLRPARETHRRRSGTGFLTHDPFTAPLVNSTVSAGSGASATFRPGCRSRGSRQGRL